MKWVLFIGWFYQSMPEITFIFRVDNQVKFGKYSADYISDDHEGLDTVIHCPVLNCWNMYRNQLNLNPIQDIQIGILGYISDNEFCSQADKFAFDMYIESESFQSFYYINGKQIN